MPIPTVDQFVEDFKEFADEALYPQETVQYWLDVAGLMLTGRWDDCYVGRNTNSVKTMLYLGAELFAAHNMALAGRDLAAAKNGGGAGIASATGAGAVAAKAVDQVSISYDVQATAVSGAGAYNLTTYGTRFIQMARMVGAGGLQVGFQNASINPMIPVPQGPAWVGPWIDLGWGWD
jgi:hypothetical protein